MASDPSKCPGDISVSISDRSMTKGTDIREDLRTWSLAHNINHSALDSLLRVLRQNGHRDLPKTARTLLGTENKKGNIQMISDMEYMFITVSKIT